MKAIDVIREVKLKANGQWQGILSNIGAELPLNQHTACPACGGKDRFRFDDKDGNGTFICNQCGAGDGLDLVQRVLGVGVTEAAKEVAGLIGIDTRSNNPPARKDTQIKTRQAQHEAQQAQNQANEQAEKLKRFTERYNRLLSQVQQGESAYLNNKGLSGFTMSLLADGSLLLPLVNAGGTVTGAQVIKPNGDKRHLTDSTKKGSYYPINKPEHVAEVIITEGLATALTCHLIRPDALTAAAIDAGNLEPVAVQLRNQYTDITIIIAADNDIKPDDPNTGRLSAEKAAKAVNGWVALPPTEHKADWDDYRQQNGIEVTKQAFSNGLYQVGEKMSVSKPVVINLDEHRAKERDPLKPFIDSRKNGIYFVTPKVDKESGEIIQHEQWLSNPIKRVIKGMNDSDQEYLIIEWRKKDIQVIPIPMGDIGEREGWRTMKNAGLLVTTKPGLRQTLSDWLLRRDFGEEWRITRKSGWYKGAYIMPDGSVIGKPEQPILFNGQSAAAAAYQVSGTAENWRNEVARLANGNIFMMFAIGTALAAPMTGITQADSFGIHFYAQSTAGKSTSADMAASLYGHPDLQRLTWYGTEYGIANEAVAHNDGLLYLDEIGQGTDPKHVYKSAYTLFNGKGKIQGAKDGGNRPMESWRTVAISTGEKDIETYLLNAGVKINAGQLVRLLNIPIERATELHECETGKEHADSIKIHCRANYGVAGRYWIEYLSQHKAEAMEAYRAAQKRWSKLIPSSYGEQVHRASDRFAAIEAALLMGCVVTGWSEQDCRDTVQAVFNVWLAEFGTGNKEIEQIVEQATAFLNTYGMSRYAPLPYDERDLPIRDLAGYREKKGGHDDAPIIFYTLPSAFKGEMAKGFNTDSFAAALATIGMLKKPAKGKGYQGRTPRLKHLGNTQQRAYVMMLIPDDEE
jgi:putative DNA primase/helicase